jgi:hypothetical protein
MIAPLSALSNGNSRSPRAKAPLVESPRHLEGYALRLAFRFVGFVAGFVAGLCIGGVSSSRFTTAWNWSVVSVSRVATDSLSAGLTRGSTSLSAGVGTEDVMPTDQSPAKGIEMWFHLSGDGSS